MSHIQHNTGDYAIQINKPRDVQIINIYQSLGNQIAGSMPRLVGAAMWYVVLVCYTGMAAAVCVTHPNFDVKLGSAGATMVLLFFAYIAQKKSKRMA